MSGLWGEEGPDLIWATVPDATVGNRVDIVFQLACSNIDGNECLVVVYPCGSSARVVGLPSLHDRTQSVTVLDALCVAKIPQIGFQVDEVSTILEHEVPQLDNFHSMLEICSGIGIGALGFMEVGIDTKIAVEQSPAFAEAFRVLHPQTSVIEGDIMHRSTLVKTCVMADSVGTMFAGFPCQPYSRAGSHAGGSDSRALPLRNILQVAMLRRIPLIFLECVPDASRNRFVRKHLQSFCAQCKYHLTETMLRLELAWPCRRERWWVVLSAAAIGPIPLREFPQYAFPSQIKHVLPAEIKFPPEELLQLELTPEEHAKFLKYHPNLATLCLRRTGVCPTVLHSLGSQMVACKCGCRSSGFSETTLAKGVFGFVFPMAGKHSVDGIQQPKFRHPHPSEVAVLTGTPVRSWPADLRLTLAGLGQQAAPAHAVWISSQALARVQELILGKGLINPRRNLDLFFEGVLACAKDLPTMLSDSNEGDVEEIPVEDWPLKQTVSDHLSDVRVLDFWARRHGGDADSFSLFSEESSKPVIVKLSQRDLTLGNLRAAEVGMLPIGEKTDIVDAVTEELLENDSLLAGKSILIRPVAFDRLQAADRGTSPKVEPVVDAIGIDNALTATVPFTIEEPMQSIPVLQPESVTRVEGNENAADMVSNIVHDPLASLHASELVQLKPPLVPNLQTLASLTTPTMPAHTRQQVLAAQDSMWADDEIRWHLRKIISKQEKCNKIMLDPLLATHVVQSGQTFLIFRWAQQMPATTNAIVTAVWIKGHWIPFAWTWTKECTTARSWDIQGTQTNVNVLHDAIAKAVGSRSYMSHISYRQFALTAFCGVCAVRWLDNFITGKMLPTNQEEAEHLNGVAKQLFLGYLETDLQVPRPWIWADGLDASAHARLVDLLIQHGVPQEEIEKRTKLVVQGIGSAALQKALLGSSPWRSVKALANQASPVVQLILPDELAAVIKQKAEAGGFGRKNKKRSTVKPVAPQPPVAIDPTKLRFGQGLFVDEKGESVAQISVGNLGPAITGVALATYDDVAPFIRAEQQISKGAVGVFLLNASEDCLPKSLAWIQCRVAVRCIANGEPVLLTGYLIQLGHSTISIAKKTDVVEAGDVQAACVKITIYRDAFPGQWEDFVKAPVRTLLQWLTPLEVCDQGPICGCVKWHRTDENSIRDPILDIWRRQWLNMSFKQATPLQADLFAVNLRYIQELEESLLSMSGEGGVFLEPRSLDSKSPTMDYHVIWMPRSNLQDLMHLRQTIPEILGLARLGMRMGIRTSVAHANVVGQQVKPDAIQLTSGVRLQFDLGPVPYGMDRAAVATLCSSCGWKVKPIAPIKSIDGVLGVLWLVHASTEPPTFVFSTKHGDIVVNRREAKTVQGGNPQVPLVASDATLQLCTFKDNAHVGEDPLVKNDPWSSAVARLKTSPPVPPEAALNLRHVEARIEKAVLAKIPRPAEPMDVDSNSHSEHSDRISQLEAQVNRLTAGQSNLEAKLDESQRKTDVQFSQMQHQVAAQMESQSNHMEELFRGQLSQIESLLGKRARME